MLQNKRFLLHLVNSFI